MKSNYVTPQVMVFAFEKQDVIKTSSPVPSTPETTRNFNSAWLD